MRKANGRDEETGDRDGNPWWVGLALGMVVLDTLSGAPPEAPEVRNRWMSLLGRHGISEADATLIYELRCSLLHGYGLPAADKVDGRNVLLTPSLTGYAVDTSQLGEALVSVPLFCSGLVERIAAESPDDWDVAQINTNMDYLGSWL